MSNNKKILIALAVSLMVILAAIHFSGSTKPTGNTISQNTTTSTTRTETSTTTSTSDEGIVALPIVPMEDISSVFNILPSAKVSGLKSDRLTDSQRQSIASAYLVTKFHAIKALLNGDVDTYQSLSYVNLPSTDKTHFFSSIRNYKASGSTFKLSSKVTVLGIIVAELPPDLSSTLTRYGDQPGQYEISILIQSPVSLNVSNSQGVNTNFAIMPDGKATSLNIFSTGDLDTTPGSPGPWVEKFEVGCDDITNPSNAATCLSQ